MSDDVHTCRVKPAEERLAARLGPVDKLHAMRQDLVVDGLHSIRIERARIFDPLLADLAPTWLDGRIVLVRRPAVQHVARADLVDESGWVVGMRRVFHGVEVIKIAEELFEAVNCRQIFVEIAQVILSELACRVAHRLENGSNGGCLGRNPNFRACLADGGQTGSNRQLPGDEVGSAGRATRLRVVVGEPHTLSRHSVEVRRATRHHALVIRPEVKPPDIVTHDDDNIGGSILWHPSPPFKGECSRSYCSQLTLGIFFRWSLRLAVWLVGPCIRRSPIAVIMPPVCMRRSLQCWRLHDRLRYATVQLCKLDFGLIRLNPAYT